MLEKINKPRQRFKELRKSKGTQLRVALDMGVTETTVRSLEKGRSKPSVENLFAFSRYFGTDVYDLWPDLATPEPLEQGVGSVDDC